MFVAVLSVVGDVLSSAFIAYGFAQLRFPGRRILFLLMISTMMFPFAVRMIPLFLMFKQFDWINTYYPLIIPSYLGTHAFFIFLLHQFFLGHAAGTDRSRPGSTERTSSGSGGNGVAALEAGAGGGRAFSRSSRAGTSSCRRCSTSTTRESTRCRSGLYSLISGDDIGAELASRHGGDRDDDAAGHHRLRVHAAVLRQGRHHVGAQGMRSSRPLTSSRTTRRLRRPRRSSIRARSTLRQKPDVLVCGAGCAGTAAAIAAARHGATVMLIEQFGFAGGYITGVIGASFDGCVDLRSGLPVVGGS